MSGRGKRAGWLGLLVPLVVLVLLVGVGVYLQGLLPGGGETDDGAPPLMDLTLPDADADDEDAVVADASGAEALVVESLRVRVVRWPDGGRLDAATVELALASGDTEAFALLGGEGLERDLPLEAYPLTVTASAPGYATRQVQREAPGLARLELPPLDGWFVRITDPLGTPHAGVDLDVFAHWIPRPTWVHDRELGEAFVAWETRRRVSTSGPSNADGYVHIEPLADDDTLVDLVYAVRGSELACEPLRVPLPHDRQHLPDAILRSVEPVEVVVVDEFGVRLRGARVELDAGPGVNRAVVATRPTDAKGVARAPRHKGFVHLRALHDGHDAVRVSVDGQARAFDDEGWLPVLADERAVECVLARNLRVFGTVIDSLSGQPAADVRAVLTGWTPRGRLEDLLETVSDASGVVDLEVPARLASTVLELRLEFVGAPPVTLPVAAVSADVAVPEAWYIPRPPGETLMVNGAVRGVSGVVSDALVSVWTAPSGTVGLDEIVYEPDEPWRRQWHGEAVDGLFSAFCGADVDDQLVIVADRRRPDGTLEFVARWGPRPVHEALSGRVLLSEAEALPQVLALDRGDDLRDRIVVRRTWSPWAREPTESRWFTRGNMPSDDASAPRRISAAGRDRWLDMRAAPAGSYVQFELLSAREPVELAVDRAEWDGRALRDEDHATAARMIIELGHGEPRRLAGLIGRDVPVAWSQLGVSLLASPSRARSPELLGRHDSWARVTDQGTFRMLVPATAEDAPLAALLHRPLAGGRVEVFLHMSTTVDELPEQWPPKGSAFLDVPRVLPTLAEWLDD